MSCGRIWTGAVVLAALLASTAQAGPYDAAVLTDGPIGYWRFEEANTGLPVADSGSSGTTGTYVGITLQPNSFNANLGQSAGFSGSANIDFGSDGVGALGQLTNVDSGAGAPGDPNPNKKTSVEFWIRTTQTGDGENWRSPTIFGDESPGDGDVQWGYIRPDGRIASIAVNDANHRHHESANPINDNAFHHIVATYDWSTRTSQLFVDGAFESNFTGGTNIYEDSDGRIRDMGYNRGHGARFVGEYDEVAIYDYILTSGQVAAHYAASTIPPYDTTLTSIATADWHLPGTWTGGPPDVPTANTLANVHDGYTVTVSAGNAGVAMDVDIDGASTLQINDTLTVGGNVEVAGTANVAGTLDVTKKINVASGGAFSATGTVNADELNTAGTTTLLGGGTLPTVNVTGGTATLATPTIGTLNVSGGVAGVGPPGLAVTDLTVGPAGTVNATGNLQAVDMDLRGTVNITNANIASTGTTKLNGTVLNSSGTVGVTGDVKVSAKPNLNVASGHLTIDVPAGDSLPGGLQLWLDASDIQGNGTPTVNGQAVTTWVDKSGNHTASNGGDPTAVVFTDGTINNQAAVRLDGNDWIRTNLSIDAGVRPNVTIFAVYDYRQKAGDDSLWGQEDGGWDRFTLLNHSVGPGISHGNGMYNVTEMGQAGIGFVINEIQMAEGVSNGSHVLINGNAPSNGGIFTMNASAGGPANQFAVGAERADNGNWATMMDVAEFLVFGRVLNADERNDVGGYLAAKYGLTTGYTGGLTTSFGELTMAPGSELTLAGAGAASFDSIVAGSAATIHGDVTAKGPVAPGGSVGTLNIDGSYTQAAGSIYQWEADTGAEDRIAVTGDLDVSPAWGLQVTPLGHSLNLNGRTLMTSGGTITPPTTVNVSLADNVYADLYDLSAATVSQSGSNVVLNGVVQKEKTVASAGGDWHTGGNWDNGVPADFKAAVVDGGTVTMSAGNGDAKDLAVAGGNLHVQANTLNVVNNVRIGPGSELKVEGGAHVSVGSEAKVHAGGTLHLSNGGTLGSAVKVLDGGTLKTTGDMDMPGNVEFEKNGTLRVASGTLSISGGVPIPSGMLVHYKFDETSGDTAVNSANPGSNDGVRLGTATWTNDPTRGQVIEFHNDNGSIGVDTAISSAHMTVATWLYADTLQGNWDVVMNHDGWSGGDVHYQFQSGDVAGFDVNGPGDMDFNAFTFNEDQWYHVVVTWGGAGDDARLYVDGDLKQTIDRSPFTVNIAPGNIGAWNGNSRQWDGMMDDFIIYDRALTDDEVEDLYAATGGTGGTMVLGNLLVNSGATLLNTGTGALSVHNVSGGGTVDSGLQVRGAVSPGDSVGRLTVTGDATLADGAGYLWELGGSGMVAGVDYDTVGVGGALTMEGDWVLALLDAGGTADPSDVFYLFEGFTSQSGEIIPLLDPSMVDPARWDVSGLSFGVDQTGLYMTGLSVQPSGIQDIPEPATMLAVGLSLAALGGYIRRRKKS